MCIGPAARVLALLFPLFVLTASTSASAEDKAPAPYPTPNAVFDAYRDARVKREWRKVFSLMTPEAQNNEVFECFFECAERGSKAAQLVVQKYLDGRGLNDEYEKRKKENSAKMAAAHKDDPYFNAPPPDPSLLRDVVAEHVKDKAGFFDAVVKLMCVGEPIHPLGDLKSVVIKGNSATGRAMKTLLPRPGESPTPPGQAPTVYEKTVEFRRINGGWLINTPP
jgi:hypothetical protein